MKKQDFKNLIPVFFLIGAIILSPSFYFGEISGGKLIEIRIEDILIAILGLFLIAGFLISKKDKIEKIPLFFPILLWLGIGFLSVLTNLIFNNLTFDKGFFYLLKEFEFFFIYFYVFIKIRNIKSFESIINVFLFFVVLNIFFVFYQIINSVKFGDYGVAAISESGAYPTGAFFLIIFIFLFNIFLYHFLISNKATYKKIIFGLICFSLVIGIWGTASRTNILGFIFSFFLTSILLFLKKAKTETILVFVLIFFILITGFILINYLRSSTRIAGIENRMVSVLAFDKLLYNFKIGRWDFNKAYYEEIIEKNNLLFLFIGFGKGYVIEAHNQYLRNFIEIGILGSLIFFFFILSVLKEGFKNFFKSKESFASALWAGVLISTFTMIFMSFATEVFITVKPSEIYWLFLAFAFGVQYRKEKKWRIKNNHENSAYLDKSLRSEREKSL